MSASQPKRIDADSDLVLAVDSLHVDYETEQGPLHALRDVSLRIREGEILGVAGESGSGKSTLAYAILQYLDSNGSVTGGTIQFRGRDLNQLSGSELRSIRGNQIAHSPQDPATSLNPSIRIGKQITETISLHQDVSKAQAHRRMLEVLEQVQITEPEYNAERYPHELSGGMQQRALLAKALSCNPELLILDEPTTGLDVTTQAKILDLVDDLKASLDTSILLITHDLGVIAEIADRIAILYAGELMEVGRVTDVFNNPANPYTRGLLGAVSSVEEDSKLVPIPGHIPDLTQVPGGCIFADRCEFAEPDCRTDPIDIYPIPNERDHDSRCRRWETVRERPRRADPGETSSHETGEQLLSVSGLKKFYGSQSVFDRIFDRDPSVKAVNGVDLAIDESETVGLVGESGCGKSTLGRTILRLHRVTEGTIRFRGEDITQRNAGQLQDFRAECQIVFQNPRSSLNPQKSVFDILRRPIELFTDVDESSMRERMGELLRQVELGPEYASRYPHELSGGEQQRVAIARAFAANPSLVVLDEPVSALDVSVQASIMNLLAELREEYGVAYLLISHDLSVVNHLSDRIAVMYLGKIVEIGSAQAIFDPPYHPYTRTLLSSVPSTDPTKDRSSIRLEGSVPSARDPPDGCQFHSRCPQYIDERCERDEPTLERRGDSDHRLSCHHDEAALSDDLVSGGS